MRKVIFTFVMVCLTSCHFTEKPNTNSHLIAGRNNFQPNQAEVNEKVSQSTDEKLPDGDTQTFAKTFFTKSRYDSSKGTIVYHPYLIEFKDHNSKGIGAYVDGKRKAFSKFENNNPRLRADFLETNESRYFVLVIGATATGTCGDSAFAVVKLEDDLKVTISQANEPECQGELYAVKIENIEKSNTYYRQISIGKLKFNADSFEWIKDK